MKLKDIAQQVGVSSSYLSQVRHGKRPASNELMLKLSKLGVEKLSKIKQREFAQNKASAIDSQDCNIVDLNRDTLGNSLTVGQRTLDPSV